MHIVLALIITAVLFTGLFLWVAPSAASGLMSSLGLDSVPHDAFRAGEVRLLGNQIVGGGVVAVAVFMAEIFVNRRFQQEAGQRREQENLQNSLNNLRDLRGIDLRGRNLASFFLQGKDFSDTDLSDVNFARSSLLSVDFSGANLTNANFSRATLRGSTFLGAILRKASFVAADLTDADFGEADLTETDLRNAVCRRTNFRGALLDRTKNLRYAILEEAVYDSGTRWPTGFDPKSAGATEA